MTYCLDTNILIHLLRGRFLVIETHMRRVGRNNMAVASMVKAELLVGAEKSDNPTKNHALVADILDHLAVLPFDSEAASFYAQMRVDLERKGQIVGAEDLVIAATAASRGAIVVTHNVKDFAKIPGVRVEDWTKP